MEKKLREFLSLHPLRETVPLSDEQWHRLADIIEEDYLSAFLSSVIGESEEIMAIDPGLERREILQIAAACIVKDLGAEAASIRLFDPETHRMIAFGSNHLDDYQRLATVPLQDSIAGTVVRENRSIVVPSILANPLYKDKEIVHQRGLHSLLAVPLRIPRFIDSGVDILGSVQIYYREDNRRFTALETIHAELLTRRVSFVLAKKKIIDLDRLNRRKETIVDKIFVKISNREGIKIKDLFMLLFPELQEILQVQSCSLFTLSEDGNKVHLEAAHPLDMTYHDPGYTFTLDNHPYFKAAVRGGVPYGDYPNERIAKSYVLIKEPFLSKFSTRGLREFTHYHHLRSILLVPLRIQGQVRHLLTFFGTDHRQWFTDEEIELLLFFGKEVMKASRLEFLGDMLHDFKNPAVAVAGLAARARKLLGSEDLNAVRGKLTNLLDVVAREGGRLQDIALTMTGEGHAETVELGQVAGERFRLNRAVIQESGRGEITVRPFVREEMLPVHCSPPGLTRVIDNLLNNATKAIPTAGGELAMRCFRRGAMACLEVDNTGAIPASQIEQVRRGQVKGRGLGIILRFVQANHGNIDIRTEGDRTVTTIQLPLRQPPPPAPR